MDFFNDKCKTCKQGVIEIEKDDKNLIGITIGGGAPHCPLVYLVQIFDNGPAYRSGVLEPGDEIFSVNGRFCRGWSKHDVAKYINSIPDKVKIGYIKLGIGLDEGITPDIFLKKIKHKFVENVSVDTADALGLSRAVLCKDQISEKVINLDKMGSVLKELKKHFSQSISKMKGISASYKNIGYIFSDISCHDTNDTAQDSFRLVAESHQFFGLSTEKLVQDMDRVIEKIQTFITKIIPDTKVTLKKYLDNKFEYLSFCLKVREMEEEEADVLYDEEIAERLQTGNFEYRMNLRCRHLSKTQFITSKKDLMEKMELLEQKNVEQIVEILQQYASANFSYYDKCYEKSLILEKFNVELSKSFDSIK